MQQALNAEFAPDENSPVATIHDGGFPYLQGLSSNKKFPAPEDEGQHFQNVFPPFHYRQKAFNEASFSPIEVGKLAYLADKCTFDNPQIESTSHLGSILLDEWSPFWNASATFLIQKTPTLDVKFHESVKVLPTLHVIIVRHPMTSSYLGQRWMGLVWLDAWSHTLELLASGEIEWYAVVTYEALIQYHDKVVEELMQVVRNGMKRFGSKTVGEKQRTGRRLHLHDSSDPLTYLVPKDNRIKTWETCMKDSICKDLLEDLTTDILPQFGYVNAGKDEGSNISNIERFSDILTLEDDLWDVIIPDSNKDEAPTSPRLSSNPGTVTSSSKFSHVLFTSETQALGNSKDDIGILVAKMKEVLAKHRKKYPEKKTNDKARAPKQTAAEETAATKKLGPKMDRYWKLEASQAHDISCEIDIKDEISQPATAHRNQFVVNVHGLVSVTCMTTLTSLRIL